jgi:hypothetical protein
MSLVQRVKRLEVLVQGEAPPPTPEPTPEGLAWLRLLLDRCELILATMPEHRGRTAFDLLEAGEWFEDPIVVRLVDLARAGLPAPDHAWRPWLARELFALRCLVSGPLALPEATCDLLDAHLNTIFASYTCERCGYLPGERPSSEWGPGWREGGRIGAPRRSFVERCPIRGCGGVVRYAGYMLSRGKCIQAAQSPEWGRERNIRCPHPENECPGAAWRATHPHRAN